MSTKSSISYNEQYHFYRECFVDGQVYLRLDGANLEFEVYPNSVMIGIKAEHMDQIAEDWLEYRKIELREEKVDNE